MVAGENEEGGRWRWRRVRLWDEEKGGQRLGMRVAGFVNFGMVVVMQWV